MTLTVELTSGYDTVFCSDTSDFETGMRVEGAKLSDTAIIESIESATSFTLSESAQVDGEFELVFTIPSQTEAIELEILRILRNSITDYVVELFPNDPSIYVLTHPNGAILIHYFGSPFSEPGDIGAYGQTRELSYQITVIGRNLRNNLGIQKQMEAVRNALTGHIPYGCDEGLFQTDESFMAEYAGEWHYAMWFKTKGIYR
jgi:hypothetical protein